MAVGGILKRPIIAALGLRETWRKFVKFFFAATILSHREHGEHGGIVILNRDEESQSQ